MNQLQITEIFLSLQGEGLTTGVPTVFVRLTGCPMRCSYCDTEYAFYGGQAVAMDEILAKVQSHGVPDVLVTGGEPLAQKGCLELLSALCDAGLKVSLETGGAISTARVDPRVTVILDVKTPASGEAKRNRPDNLQRLKPQDQVKFVICDRDDYEWSRRFVSDHQLAQRSHVLFSPVAKTLEPTRLADWIVADRLPVRFQLQLHKLLWGDEPGR